MLDLFCNHPNLWSSSSMAMPMQVPVRFPYRLITAATLAPPLTRIMKITTKRLASINAKKLYKVDEDDDDNPFLEAAIDNTLLRYIETLRPDPLFVDPYIECLLPPGIQFQVTRSLHDHCVATKFIDDKLCDSMKKDDGLRQVVLLTDGMDTRPYRINWPLSTVIFDVSPEHVFRDSTQKLQDVGSKIPRSCLFLHISSDTSDIQQTLRGKGFNGARPSVWVLQGLPILTLTHFRNILGTIGSLATKGSLFFGELPVWLAETENEMKASTIEWVDKLFMSHGLRVEMIEYDQVAEDCGVGNDRRASSKKMLLVVAEQLQFSDDQMEIWRGMFQRIEEDADEDGFEEL